MKRSSAQRAVLTRIGNTLIQIQRTEWTLQFCIKHVVPKTARPSKDIFDNDGRRPPLGRLISELHRQVVVANNFKATLTEYLEKRNIFVHQIEGLAGWTLHTDKGLNVGGARDRIAYPSVLRALI